MGVGSGTAGAMALVVLEVRHEGVGISCGAVYHILHACPCFRQNGVCCRHVEAGGCRIRCPGYTGCGPRCRQLRGMRLLSRLDSILCGQSKFVISGFECLHVSQWKTISSTMLRLQVMQGRLLSVSCPAMSSGTGRRISASTDHY
jgi:hypothetical protein